MIGACFARIGKWVLPAPFGWRVRCPNSTEHRLSGRRLMSLTTLS